MVADNMPDWEKLKEIFHTAVSLPPNDRCAYLDHVCAGHALLRQSVESLLKSHEQSGFVDEPAYAAAANLLIDDERRAQLEFSALQPKKNIGRYRINSLLAEGGMGRVYLAEDTKLHRKVSLKFLSKAVISDHEKLLRFEREARAASALNHPNILTIHEFGEEDDQQFIATEYIEGQTLRERLQRSVELDDALEIAIQIASALVAAHRVNIVHRDIKPDNVIIRKDDGLVKVLDFGLAKVVAPRTPEAMSINGEAPTRFKTGPGVVMGTVAYMSPEQARGDKIDERTDIWSLGIVLYEMIAGSTPFVAETSNEIISGILSKHPAPPLTRFSHDVPERLQEIVEKALTKNRDARYQTSKDLLIDLKRVKQSLEIQANIDRSPNPDTATSNGQGVETLTVIAPVRTTHPTSSAEYIVNQVKRHKRGVIITLALLLLAIAAGPFIYGWRTKQNIVAVKPDFKSLEIHTIAVLPLANLSGDATQEYFADGMTDELITEIAGLADIQVISRGSVMRFKNSTTPVPEIARQLSADAVLTGSVVRAGDRTRITVQLISATTDSHLWAKSYERDLKDVLLLQRDIASDLGQKISPSAGQQPLEKSGKPRQIDPAAHDAYLRGVYEWNKWDKGAQKAVEYFTAAIHLDPSYSNAHAGLANAYSHFGIMGIFPPEVAWPKAEAAALKTLELDDSSAEAHAALGYIKSRYYWEWADAEAEFLRAIELNPNNATVHHWYGLLLAEEGRFDEGIRETQRAEDLDPLSILISASVGRRFYLSRRYDQAIAQFQRTLEMNPDFGLALSGLGAAYIQVHRYPEAIAVLEKAAKVAKDNPESLPVLGFAYALSGDHARARAILSELQAQSKSHYVSPCFTAIIHAGMGETDKAVRDLQQAARDRSNWMTLIGTEPIFDSLRSDPRFIKLLGKVGFPPTRTP